MKYNFTDGQSRVDALLVPEITQELRNAFMVPVSRKKIKSKSNPELAKAVIDFNISKPFIPPTWLFPVQIILIVIAFFALATGFIIFAYNTGYANGQLDTTIKLRQAHIDELHQQTKDAEERTKELQERIRALTYYISVEPEKTNSLNPKKKG